MKWQLIVDSGHRKGQVITLPRATCLIGRDSACQLRPVAPSIEQQHCALKIRGDKLFAEDLHTNRGTCVNGRRIRKEQELRPGDCLQIGPIVFLIAVIDGERARPAAEVDEDLVARLLLALDEGEEEQPEAAGSRAARLDPRAAPTVEGAPLHTQPAKVANGDGASAATAALPSYLRRPRG